jgi:glyoxylase-like metal-dependent hydrolase (beta-lactamase superfamily II)
MKVACHPKGIPHLIDPSRLWEGSRKVLGSLALEYGPITPVSSSAILAAPPDQATGYPLRVIETPGHASHHQSFLVGDLLFAGEAAGIYLDLDGEFYTRPASPPVFDIAGFRGSIAALKQASASFFCFAHYGFSTRPADVLRRAEAQMDLWVSVIEKQLRSNEAFSVDSALRELFGTDPVLNLFGRLPGDIAARERHFMGNAIAGIAGCLKKGAERGIS